MKTFDPKETATIVASWTDAHKYSPAPRHRRRLMLKMVEDLDFGSCLDAGCAHADFLQELSRRKKGVSYQGCDLCKEVIDHNRGTIPGIEFSIADLTQITSSDFKQYDLVVTSEVLEHIENWQLALENLLSLSSRYALITVPAGRRHAMDRRIGHFKHYTIEEVSGEVAKAGFRVRKARYWGFPFHSAYKYAINAVMPDYLYTEFGETRYGAFKKLFCESLYLLFFLNDFGGSRGPQLLLLAERTG
jgi:hypothetical protein